MKRKIIGIIMLTTIGLSGCNNTTKSEEKLTQINMKNLISIIEIPVSDFSRSLNFYKTILETKIEEMQMDGNQMGVFPNEEGTVSVILIKGNDYKPTSDGVLLYLNAGNDLQPILDRIEQNGGQVILPKTLITEEMGYFALFIDSEGNKLGLHSSK